MNADASDLDSIREIINGDTARFGDLVAKYQSRVFRLITCMTANREDAADLTQETFIQAFRGLANFRNESTFYTWLYRIALNVTFRATVRNRRLLSSITFNSDTCDEAMDALADALSVGPLHFLEEKELLGAIDRALDELPERLGAVFFLRVIDDLSYSAIADAEAIPLNTVRSRLWRARAQLATKLATGPAEHKQEVRAEP